MLLERDICGGGPSGRNGGFVNGLYDEAGLLLERYGAEGRRRVEMAARSIDEIGAWCEDARRRRLVRAVGRPRRVDEPEAHDAAVRRPWRRRNGLGSATCTGR